jgi:aminoglycoside 6'-N-acetyltransferase I
VYVLYPVNRQTAEIKAIAVSESHQNQGIGKFMLKDAEIKAREKGFRRLLIGTPATAIKQLAIYQKAGFVPFDILVDFYTLNYSRPIVEDGVQLKDRAILEMMIA